MKLQFNVYKKDKMNLMKNFEDIKMNLDYCQDRIELKMKNYSKKINNYSQKLLN